MYYYGMAFMNCTRLLCLIPLRPCCCCSQCRWWSRERGVLCIPAMIKHSSKTILTMRYLQIEHITSGLTIYQSADYAFVV